MAVFFDLADHAAERNIAFQFDARLRDRLDRDQSGAELAHATVRRGDRLLGQRLGLGNGQECHDGALYAGTR
jgi:hypothetical protein